MPAEPAVAVLTTKLTVAYAIAESARTHLRYALDGLTASDTTDLTRWIDHANDDAHNLERLVHRLFADVNVDFGGA
jgi:hypothetical protein